MELLIGVGVFFVILGGIASIVGHNQVKAMRKKIGTPTK